MGDHVTRYDLMPIPPVDEHTEYFEAGAVIFGVEYRLLTDAIAAASDLEDARGGERSGDSFDDRGVSIHVFGAAGGKDVEHLRFDCFNEDPHYHYVSFEARSNEMIHIDPVADGDPLVWALERIRTRLPQMLERAGTPELASQVDQRLVEVALPRVSEAAWRLRFHHDEAAVLEAALRGKGG
jgi:hypothetical protein